jgi:N-acetylmuramoyl-L-alanine amidase
MFLKKLLHFSKIPSVIVCLLWLYIPDYVQAQSVRISVHTIPALNGFIRGISGAGEYSGDNFVPVKEFASFLDIPLRIDDNLKKIILTIERVDITLSVDNPFVVIGENLFQMPLEVREYRSEIFIPVREFTTLLDRHLPGSYAYDPELRYLDVGFSDDINITDLYIEEKTNGSLIHISTTKYFGENLNYWFDESKYNLTVEFYTGRLDTLFMTSEDTRGLVLRNTAVQHPEIASITFRLSRYVDDITVTQTPTIGEILISLLQSNTEISTDEYSFELNELAPNFSEDIVARDRESWNVNTVVIDPGHGGKDPGTVGENGLYEKDIVLDIARFLGNLLRKSNLVENVIYSRNSDEFVSLKKRTEIANDSGGKLFISIHVNANKNKKIRGFETYFLHPGKNRNALEVLEVVQRENNVIDLYENSDPAHEFSEEELMILSITQNAFVKESEQLAAFISEGIDRKVNWTNKGVKQAGFVVLWGVSMPNVLVEAGFITNSQDRNDLQSLTVKHRIAEGIFEGIRKFIDEIRS